MFLNLNRLTHNLLILKKTLIVWPDILALLISK